VTFPNGFQHQVAVQLDDFTKAGAPKILALFLSILTFVLYLRLIYLFNRGDGGRKRSFLAMFPQLPVEIYKEVIDNVDDFPISPEMRRLCGWSSWREESVCVSMTRVSETTFIYASIDYPLLVPHWTQVLTAP